MSKQPTTRGVRLTMLKDHYERFVDMAARTNMSSVTDCILGCAQLGLVAMAQELEKRERKDKLVWTPDQAREASERLQRAKHTPLPPPRVKHG